MRFLLVDRILDCQPGGPIRGLKNVALSEDVLAFHFPGNPVMPGVLLLESMIQLAGWLEASSSDFQNWFLVERVQRCAYYGFAFPGDQVEFELTPLPEPGPGHRAYRGIGTVAGRKKVLAEFEGTLTPLADLEDPARQRRLYEVLNRPGRT